MKPILGSGKVVALFAILLVCMSLIGVAQHKPVTGRVQDEGISKQEPERLKSMPQYVPSTVDRSERLRAMETLRLEMESQYKGSPGSPVDDGSGVVDRTSPTPEPVSLVSVKKRSRAETLSGVSATYTVINTGDAGVGSLRWAVAQANANPGADIIDFSLPGPGPSVINLSSPLDVITEDVFIDGWSVGGPGYTGPPKIIINGAATTNAFGFNVQAPNVTIRGVSIIRFGGTGTGIGLLGSGTTNCWIYGNYLGVDTMYLGAGNGRYGVRIDAGATGNLIGTDGDGTNDEAERNLIGGNGYDGVYIANSDNNTVAGNYIGVYASYYYGPGLFDAGNVGAGVRIDNGDGNTVGGSSASRRNVISGNDQAGILLLGGSGANTIAGNFIGTDTAGNTAFPNAGGITIDGSPGNIVGGTSPGSMNIVSGNTGNGISVSGSINTQILGNRIGTDVTGNLALPNTYSGVWIVGCNGTIIGDSDAGNIISENDQNGIFVGGLSSNSLIRGNFVGINAAGDSPLPNGHHGVVLYDAGSGNVVGGVTGGHRNIISGNTWPGVAIGPNSSGNSVQGNYLGTDVSGSAAIGNHSGVTIYASSSGNVIGGSAPGAGNLISGNQFIGINIGTSDDNVIAGNMIGTDVSGTTALPNQTGIMLSGSHGNTIGGDEAVERNVIAGNLSDGILIDFSSMGNFVQGNYIGLNVTGLSEIGNTYAGVAIVGNSTNNTIGGLNAGEGNLISGNGYDGIYVYGSDDNTIAGNSIGTDLAGTLALPNQNGIWLDHCDRTIVGGATEAERNLISGNTYNGVFVGWECNDTKVLGNYLGTNMAGDAAIPNDNGVILYESGSGNIVGGTTPGERNVISGNLTNGVAINPNSDGNFVRGNYIGTDFTGTSAIPNQSNGVFVAVGCDGNVIGGPTPAHRNIISGNNTASDTWGVLIGFNSSGNTVQNNYIGVDVTGTAGLSNGVGVVIYASGNNTVESNVISGSDGYYFPAVDGYGNGVVISGGASNGNIVRNNLIGTDASGTAAIPNTTGGILVRNTAHHNLIGGDAQGNVISGNTNRGVYVLGADTNIVSGNLIGLDISGAAALPNDDGVVIAGDTNIVGGTAAGERNTISGNPGFGVLVAGGIRNNVVLGNYIGTDVGGTSPVPNGTGVKVGYNAYYNTIGSGDPAEGNLISGNAITAITVSDSAAYTSILGNLIGTNHDGTGAIPNANGIYLREAFETEIGNATGGGNLISGNIGDGIGLWSDWCLGTQIHGNRIGVLADGLTPLGNGDSLSGGIGIYGAVQSVIGGTGAGEAGNIIANNAPYGVAVHSGTQNRISANSMYGNAGLGIDLFPSGVTPNDPLDADTGANHLQNYPVLDFAASDLEAIAGTLHSIPLTEFLVEFFSNATADPSGHGEGQTYIGSTSVTTDALGDASFFAIFPGELVNGQSVSATATDPDGNTSEFSGSVVTQPRFKIFGEHFVVNTTLSGVPLHPAGGEATYYVSTGVPAEYRPAVVAGLETWADLPQLTYVDGGDTPSADWAGESDGINNIVWLTSDWEALTEAPVNAIAITRVLYNAITGELTDVDIAFNAEHVEWSTTGEPDKMDVQNTSTHEGGHGWGLGDIYNPLDPFGYVSFMGSGNENETMYGLISVGETKKSDLNAGDLAGIDYLYSNISGERVDLMLVFDGSGSFTATNDRLTPSINAAVELLDKMRTGDRVGVVRMPNTVLYPLTEIDGMAGREAVKAVISSILPGGSCAPGAGLTEAQGQLAAGGSANHTQAVILFSAGEEDTIPTVFSTLPLLTGAGTRVYTMGFPGSPGQIINDSISSATGGAYYLATATTIGSTVDNIWNLLTGQMLVSDTTVASADVPPYPQPGLKWQGAVDPGTGKIQPGLKWQGSGFRLSLIAPDNSEIDSALAASDTTDGIEFFSGPTYQYYDITGPMPGIWTLVVQGYEYPPFTEPLDLYIVATTTGTTMDIAFDDAIYAPGEPIGISTTVLKGGMVAGDLDVQGGAAVTDATVVAKVYLPDGTVEEVTLVHTGSGVYKGFFANTSKAGSYKVDIYATKEGEFQRKTTQSVYVTAPFTCPTNFVVEADAGGCSAVIEYGIEPVSGLTIECVPPTGSEFPVGTTPVICVSTDGSGIHDTCHFTVTVLNPAPVAAITNPPAGTVIPVGTVMTLMGTLTDNAGDAHTATWIVDGTEIPATVNEPAGMVSADYTFGTAGVYSIRLVVADQCGGRDTATEVGDLQAIVVVYDPSAGFVTGGGWIDSPPGAYPAAPGLTGKAVFGFVSKYQKGKDTPSGKTEFHFKVADFRFHSESHEWLVIAGARAQYTGSGTVNDAGDYKFMLSAVDGQLLNVKTADKFRIRIWDRSTGLIAYDNQPGDSDTSVATTAVAGGSVVIHKPDNVRFVGEDPGSGEGLPEEYALAPNFPNPFNPVTTIAFALPADSRVTVRVFTTLGELVGTLVEGEMAAGVYSVDFDASALSTGLYFIRFDAAATGGEPRTFTRTGKMLYIR